MAETYRGFYMNTYGDDADWATLKETSLFKSILDFLPNHATDATNTVVAAEHKHYRLYDATGVTIAAAIDGTYNMTLTAALYITSSAFYIKKGSVTEGTNEVVIGNNTTDKGITLFGNSTTDTWMLTMQNRVAPVGGNTDQSNDIQSTFLDPSGAAAPGGMIRFGKEGDYTTPDSCDDQDSFIAFHTTLDAAQAEKVRIKACGCTGFGTSLPTTAIEIAANAGGTNKGAITLAELSVEPTAPAANRVVIFAKDNGGKTALYALFPSGAAQQITIEP